MSTTPLSAALHRLKKNLRFEGCALSGHGVREARVSLIVVIWLSIDSLKGCRRSIECRASHGPACIRLRNPRRIGYRKKAACSGGALTSSTAHKTLHSRSIPFAMRRTSGQTLKALRIFPKRLTQFEHLLDPAQGLPSAFLVFDEREPNMLVTLLAEANARAHRYLGLNQ
jgi:hypothetical protein